jgi:hypothetical protein
VYTEDAEGGGDIWSVSSTDVRSAACGLAGRYLTEEEWQMYLSWAGPRQAICPQFPLS